MTKINVTIELTDEQHGRLLAIATSQFRTPRQQVNFMMNNVVAAGIGWPEEDSLPEDKPADK